MHKAIFRMGMIFFVFFPVRSQAQISGRFVTASGQTVPQVSVSLIHLPDSAQQAAKIADSTGNFNLSGAAGRLLLRASAAGYKVWFSEAWDQDSTDLHAFGDIVLNLDIRALDAVVVRAARPPFEQQPGGMVVNPSASVMTKGSTLLTVLQRSPGVTLDPQTNAIALNGKTGVTIALNGKTLTLPMEEVVRLLNEMSADEVDRIELLASPSSKFDAQGNAGLINIVMKKNCRQGTNGSLSATSGYGKGEKARALISLSNNTARTSFSGSYGFSRDRSASDLAGVSNQVFPPLGGAVEVQFTNKNTRLSDAHNAVLDFDFRPDSTITLSSHFLFTEGSGNAGTINRRIISYHSDSALNFFSDIGSRSRRVNLVSSLSLEKKWSAQSRAVLGGDWIVYGSNAPTTASSDFRTPDGRQAGHNDTLFSPMHRGYANTAIRVGVLSYDYSTRLSPSLLLETGIKGTHTGSGSRSGIESQVNGEWVGRAETSNDIRLNENIGAAYGSFSAGLKKNFRLTAGLRYEYSRTEMKDVSTGNNNVDRRFGALFPSLSVTHKWNDRETLLLSYSKRITRPSYNDLSSFVAYNDPLSVFSGNPLLKPAITHNLKLTYGYRQISLSLLASRDIHPIAEYQIVASPEQDLMIIAPQNLDWQNSLLLQMTAPLKLTQWLSLNQSVTGGWHRYRETFSEFPLTLTWFGLSVNSSLTATLPKSWAMELSGFYNSATYNGTVVTKDYWSLNGGIKKTMKGNGAVWQLSVTDLFGTLKYRSAYGKLTKEAFEGSSHLVYVSESALFPVINISYTRNFGSSISKPRSGSGSRASEEQGRIR